MLLRHLNNAAVEIYCVFTGNLDIIYFYYKSHIWLNLLTVYGTYFISKFLVKQYKRQIAYIKHIKHYVTDSLVHLANRHYQTLMVYMMSMVLLILSCKAYKNKTLILFTNSTKNAIGITFQIIKQVKNIMLFLHRCFVNLVKI